VCKTHEGGITSILHINGGTNIRVNTSNNDLNQVRFLHSSIDGSLETHDDAITARSRDNQKFVINLLSLHIDDNTRK
jgi:hypothetical protein